MFLCSCHPVATPVHKGRTSQTPWTVQPFVPKPVGQRGSGPARLSDLSLSLDGKAGPNRLLRRNPIDSGTPTTSKASRFFKPPPPPSRIKALRDDLVFDDGSTFVGDVDPETPDEELAAETLAQDGRPRKESSSSDSARSPSPICSSLASPERDRQCSVFTSPEPEDVLDAGDQLSSPTPLETPLPKRLATSPVQSPPSKKRKLSQKQDVLPETPKMDAPIDAVDFANVCASATWESSSVHEEWSIEEVVVTPAAEDREHELQTKESVKKISQSWRAKYAFDSQVSSSALGLTMTIPRLTVIHAAARVQQGTSPEHWPESAWRVSSQRVRSAHANTFAESKQDRPLKAPQGTSGWTDLEKAGVGCSCSRNPVWQSTRLLASTQSPCRGIPNATRRQP
jgi:hypothetical protein